MNSNLQKIFLVEHDMSKLGVPSAILSKAVKLKGEEFNLIRLHSVIGE